MLAADQSNAKKVHITRAAVLYSQRHPETLTIKGPNNYNRSVRETNALVRGTDGPVRGTERKGTRTPPLGERTALLIATVPLVAFIVGARANLLRNGQIIGPQLA